MGAGMIAMEHVLPRKFVSVRSGYTLWLFSISRLLLFQGEDIDKARLISGLLSLASATGKYCT